MIVVGVENILVITKSVVSTPVDLEVKIRVAQGITILKKNNPDNTLHVILDHVLVPLRIFSFKFKYILMKINE